jgi:predicted 3-demethylubiquinone-9 3-methyltransferase (glyoxalase superfamily)
MQKIAPFLRLDGKAEEAAQFSVSIFKTSGILAPLPQADGRRHSRHELPLCNEART